MCVFFHSPLAELFEKAKGIWMLILIHWFAQKNGLASFWLLPMDIQVHINLHNAIRVVFTSSSIKSEDMSEG